MHGRKNIKLGATCFSSQMFTKERCDDDTIIKHVYYCKPAHTTNLFAEAWLQEVFK